MAKWLQSNADVFNRQKEQMLSSVDLSRKGSIDEHIVELVDFINSSKQYFTTSSCSGRTIIFEESSDTAGFKKGCRWLYTTHEYADLIQVMTALGEAEGDAVFKFEPFILHVQCCSLEDARLMHEVAVASGYRNSGITISNKGKIMTAVRSTHSLEVPISYKGTLLVDEKYISYLVDLADKKMKENMTRIQRFHENLQASMMTRRPEKGETLPTNKVKPNKKPEKKSKDSSRDSSDIKETLQDDPFLCVMDECTMDVETGLFSIIYSEDG